MMINFNDVIRIDVNFSVIDSGSNQLFQLLSKFHTTESIKYFLLYTLNCYFLTILQIIKFKDNCYLIHIMAEFVLFLCIFLSRNFLKTYKIKNFFFNYCITVFSYYFNILFLLSRGIQFCFQFICQCAIPHYLSLNQFGSKNVHFFIRHHNNLFCGILSLFVR